MNEIERELDFLVGDLQEEVAALQEEVSDLKEGLAFVSDEALRMRKHLLRIQAISTIALDTPTVEKARGLHDLEPGQEVQ